MEPQQVVAESRQMLAEFLGDLGFHREGQPLDLASVLSPFSEWVDQQEITEDDRFYLASRLAAFICEYLIDNHSAERLIRDAKIFIRLPVAKGVQKEFDPYAVAVGMTTTRNSLKDFLLELTS